MTPKSADPIADWFRRHRLKLAFAFLVVVLLGRVPELVTGGVKGVVNFIYAAAFFGLVAWELGSSHDRSDAAHWRKFGLLWTALLLVQVGLMAASLARGNEFQGQGLLPLGIVGLMALTHWLPYRRIKSGKPFPPHTT